jgi:hypothetical protein
VDPGLPQPGDGAVRGGARAARARGAPRAPRGGRARRAGRPLPRHARHGRALPDAAPQRRLALAATYATDVPRYAATLSALGGDLPAFVARLREAAKAPDPRGALGAPAAPATSIREPRGRATRGRRSARPGS